MWYIYNKIIIIGKTQDTNYSGRCRFMNFRIETEKKESIFLSKYATLSKNSRGRKIEEEKCSIRTDFQIGTELFIRKPLED